MFLTGPGSSQQVQQQRWAPFPAHEQQEPEQSLTLCESEFERKVHESEPVETRLLDDLLPETPQPALHTDNTGLSHRFIYVCTFIRKEGILVNLEPVSSLFLAAHPRARAANVNQSSLLVAFFILWRRKRKQTLWWRIVKVHVETNERVFDAVCLAVIRHSMRTSYLDFTWIEKKK